MKVEYVKQNTLKDLIGKRRILFKNVLISLIEEYIKDTGFDIEDIKIVKGKKDKITIIIKEILI